MQHHKLVLPEHLNDHGSLFGGYLLKWIDEVAYMTVRIDYPHNHFVTIALDNVVFNHRIECGQILRFEVARKRLGNTSVDYQVDVFGADQNRDRESRNDGPVFSTTITFVAIDKHGDGGKTAIQKVPC